MNKLTLWLILGAFLMLVGCSKDDPTPVGPVANDQQQKKVDTSPVSYWNEWENPDWAKAEPYVKSYPASVKNGGLKKTTTADPPIVTNGGFEDGFNGWTTFVTFPGMVDFRVSPAVPHPEWAWIVGASDPFGSNTTIYRTGMLHPEPLAHSGNAGASAVENVGGIVHRLYQIITIPQPPTGGNLKLEFWIRWKNQYPETPPWVDQYQDIIVSFRDPNTDALLTNGELFKAFTLNLPPFSGGGNIITANYEAWTADVTAFAGQTVRLDFESDARGYMLYVDLDDIRINRPPVANAGPDQTVPPTEPSGATVTLDGSGSSDPDGDDLKYQWTWTGGSATGKQPTITLPLGSHDITLTVNDGSQVNASATDKVVVNVLSNRPPTANAGLDQTINCAGPAGLAVNLNGTNSSDPDVGDVLTYTWTGSFGTASGASPTVTLGGGVHTITLTVDDGKGGTATDDVIVTVNLDVTAPTVTLNGPSSITLECPGPYNEQDATVTDNCDVALSASITGSVDVHKVGTYILTYAATDAAGNTSTPVTRTVNMVDTTPPVITLNGAAEITLECPAAYNEPGAVVTDNCKPSPTLVISGSVNNHVPGIYIITYTATDANGLISTMTRTVKVVDTTPPTIVLNGANPMSLECPTPYVEPGAVVTDACDPAPSLEISGTVDFHIPGDYTITYTAKDGSNNTSTATRIVKVRDTTPPMIVLKGANPMILECPAVYNEPGAVVTDACDPSPTLTIEGTVDAGTLGTYTVKYTATDHSGNSATATRTVIVQDTKAPILSCSVSTPSLWPPNNKFVNVGLRVNVKDACDPNPKVSIKVYSDEDNDKGKGDDSGKDDDKEKGKDKDKDKDNDKGKGDDKDSPDAKDIGAGTLQLRAERSGKGDGRVYLIVVTATDKSGNLSFSSCTVVVPHSESKKAIADVNAQAAAAKASCGPNGSPLTPYLIGSNQ